MLTPIVLLISFWLFSASASAAVTCDSLASDTTEADPQPLSYPVGTTSTSNRVVVVQTSWREEGGTAVGVTFNGVAMTQIGSSVINTTPTDIGVAHWIATGVSSGTYTVSVEWSGVFTAQSTVAAFTCYDVDQSTPVRAGSATGGTANSANNVSIDIPSAATDLVVATVAVAAVDAGEPTIGAGQTVIGACIANGGANFDSCSSTEAGAATVTTSWSAGSTEFWAIHGFSLQQAAAGSTTRHRGAIWLP